MKKIVMKRHTAYYIYSNISRFTVPLFFVFFKGDIATTMPIKSITKENKDSIKS